MRIIFLFLTLSLCLLTNNGLLAQDKKALEAEREVQANITAATLVSEGLIVNIPTNTRKIAAMRELIATGDLTDANRARLRERLQNTIEQTAVQAAHIQAAFQNYYEIGPVYLMPDTALAQLNERRPSGYFYNDRLEIDPGITLPDNFVFARIGFLDPATTSGAEGLMLTYNGGEPLVRPFPAAVTFNNFGYFFNTLLAKDIAERKRWEGLVKALNKRFRRALAALEE